MSIERYGDWMQTYSGRKFWPLDPREEDIDIEDIAHALSMTCRFNGHCDRFYSVAEHSLHVSMLCPDEFKLWGLLHDSPEGYIADIISPIKKFMTNYREFEDALMACIGRKYGLLMENEKLCMPKEVKKADMQMLATEMQRLMMPPPGPWNLSEEPVEMYLPCYTPKEAELAFLNEFHLLTENKWR